MEKGGEMAQKSAAEFPVSEQQTGGDEAECKYTYTHLSEFIKLHMIYFN